MASAFACLTRTTSLTWSNGSWNFVEWDAADEQGATFWSSSNKSRITIPPALDGEVVEFMASLGNDVASSYDDFYVDLFKNGSFFDRHQVSFTRWCRFGVSFGTTQVADGDYFEIRQRCYNDNEDINLTTAHFSIATLDRVGACVGTLSADETVFSDGDVLPIDTMEINTASAFDTSTHLLTVPAGVGYVIPRFAARSLGGDGDVNKAWDLRKNGSLLRRLRSSFEQHNPGGVFGLVPVSEGDTLGVYGFGYSSDTIQSAWIRLSFELISDGT